MFCWPSILSCPVGLVKWLSSIVWWVVSNCLSLGSLCVVVFLPHRWRLTSCQCSMCTAGLDHCSSDHCLVRGNRSFCYDSSFSFSSYSCFTCTFYYFFTPVWSLYELHLPLYLCFSFTFFEAAHLTQSPYSTMMIPSFSWLAFMYKYLRDS